MVHLLQVGGTTVPEWRHLTIDELDKKAEYLASIYLFY
jgi:hypothetical protein